MKRQCFLVVDTRGRFRFSVVRCLIRKCFSNRVSSTLCESVTSVANVGKTFCLDKLRSSLGGLVYWSGMLGTSVQASKYGQLDFGRV